MKEQELTGKSWAITHPISDRRLHWENKILDNLEEAKTAVDISEQIPAHKNPWGFYIDGYLKSNLDEVPKLVKNDWDAVIIISGSGNTRTGKSYLGSQVGKYIAWKMNEYNIKRGLVPKNNPIPWSNENFVFTPKQLIDKANKFPKNSVLVYDEAYSGLNSKVSMENVSKGLQNFFTTCGFMNHIIILILPDFFSLQQTIAVPRSLFLLNCYTGKDLQRGYASFFSKQKKELLYVIGKKKWGSTSKYYSVKSNFNFRFTDVFTTDHEEYEKFKREAVTTQETNAVTVRHTQQRDILFWILKKNYKLSALKIARELTKITNVIMSEQTVHNGIQSVDKLIERGVYLREIDNSIPENDINTDNVG